VYAEAGRVQSFLLPARPSEDNSDVSIQYGGWKSPCVTLPRFDASTSVDDLTDSWASTVSGLLGAFPDEAWSGLGRPLVTAASSITDKGVYHARAEDIVVTFTFPFGQPSLIVLNQTACGGKGRLPFAPSAVTTFR
jgi:hypothetical protein